MAHRNKPRILITLIIIILTFTICTGAFAASVNDGIRLNNEGLKACQHSDFYGAAQKWEEALKIFEEHNFRKGISAAIGNLGAVYHNLGQYHKALGFYEKALAIYKEIGVPTRIVEANIGDIYLETGRMDKAKEIYERLGDPILLGRLCLVKKDYVKAIEYYHKSLA